MNLGNCPISPSLKLKPLRSSLSKRQRRRRFETLYWHNVHISAVLRAERIRRRRDQMDERVFSEYQLIVEEEAKSLQKESSGVLAWKMYSAPTFLYHFSLPSCNFVLTVSAGLGNHWMTGPVRGVCVSGGKMMTVECILVLLGQTLRARRAMSTAAPRRECFGFFPCFHTCILHA